MPEFAHGFTYSGHPLGVAAASAALDLYRDEELFERARALEPIFADAVHGLKGAPHVVDIRSIGLAAGIDLAPIDRAPGLRGARAFDAAFFDEDLVIRVVGDTIVLAPALIATEADIGGHHQQGRAPSCLAPLASRDLVSRRWAAINYSRQASRLLLPYRGLPPHDFCARVGTWLTLLPWPLGGASPREGWPCSTSSS